MEKICRVGPKNLGTNFRVEELFSAQHVCYFPVSKNLGMSTPKPDNYMQLFWTFVCESVWHRCFLICARNSDEYFIQFIPNKFLNFFIVSFFIVLLAKNVQNERNICPDLNNCHNCFFRLCSYKNNCFCVVAIKINVKV